MVAFSFGCGVQWVWWCGGWSPARVEPGSGAAQAAVGDGSGAATDGDHAGLDELLDAERLEDVEQGSELVGGAGGLDDDRVGRHVDDLGLEELDRVDDLAAGRRVGTDLDEQDLALHRGVRVELDDLEHLDELVELLRHLLERRALDLDDDRDAGDVGQLGRADGEGVDVEAASGEERCHAGQDAGLVLDEDRQGVLAHAQSSRSQTGASWRAAWIMSLLTPAGTIGHTMASRCTMKSMTTSTSSGVSARRPRQPYASASLTKSGTLWVVGCRSVLE